MTLRAATLLTLSALLLMTGARASITPDIRPEAIIQQEINLNELLINIHRLQLDFLDPDARAALQGSQQSLDASLNNLPTQAPDPEAQELLTTVLLMWPVISKHISWLNTIPADSEPPTTSRLEHALGKMERQLLLLRNKTSDVSQSHQLRYLKQALLMQHMTRDYLAMLAADASTAGHIQLKAQATRFDQRMATFNQELIDHPDARQTAREAQAAWSFIHGRFEAFPEQQTPELIVRYGHNIVSKLASVHRMF